MNPACTATLREARLSASETRHGTASLPLPAIAFGSADGGGRSPLLATRGKRARSSNDTRVAQASFDVEAFRIVSGGTCAAALSLPAAAEDAGRPALRRLG